jgi:hypothetical protein
MESIIFLCYKHSTEQQKSENKEKCNLVELTLGCSVSKNKSKFIQGLNSISCSSTEDRSFNSPELSLEIFNEIYF